MKSKLKRQLTLIMPFVLILIFAYFHYGTGYAVLQRSNSITENTESGNENPSPITPELDRGRSINPSPDMTRSVSPSPDVGESLNPSPIIERSTSPSPVIERAISPPKDVITTTDNPFIQKQEITYTQPTPQCTSNTDCEGKVKDALLVKCENGMCKPKCIDSNGNALNNWPKSSFSASECTDKNGQTWKSSCGQSEGSNAPLLIDYSCTKQGNCIGTKLACPCSLTDDKNSILMECEAGKCVGCPGSDYECNKITFCGFPSPPSPPCIGANCENIKTFGACSTIKDCVNNNNCYFMNRDGVKRFGCFCDLGACFQAVWSKENAKIG